MNSSTFMRVAAAMKGLERQPFNCGAQLCQTGATYWRQE